MSNPENTAAGAMAGSDELTKLRAQLADLQAKLDAKEGNGDVLEGRFRGEIPRYKLNAPCFLEDDTLHETGEIIDYIGIPNGEMVPQNEAARKRMQEWLAGLEQGAREVADLHGRPFHGLISDRGTLLAQGLQDARKAPDRVVFAMPTDAADRPQMPHMESHAKRGRGRPRKVLGSTPAGKAPAPGKEPTSILGSSHTQAAAGNRVG